MTRQNGKVVVTVRVPVLGNVIGSKTLEEVISGKSSQAEPKPPVECKPLDANRANSGK